MMTSLNSLRRFLRDCRGAVAIETAFVAPVLVTMSLGSFEVGNIIARQTELQAAMAEASAVALASEPTTVERRATVKSIIETSTGLGQNSVAVNAAYRCGTNTTFVSAIIDCGTANVSSYVHIVLTDSYQPVWSKFGVGSDYNYSVTRYVMIKQQTATVADDDDDDD